MLLVSFYTPLKTLENQIRGGSRTVATSKMKRFVIIVNGFQTLTIITKHSILDVAAALDPPLQMFFKEAKDMKLVYVCILYKILENWWGAVFPLRVHNYEFCEPFLFIFLQNRELLFVFHTEMFIFYLIHIQKRLKSFKEAGMKCLNNPFSSHS